jgi:2-oxo-4-hydroxy-4-carboxy-5-ureidoimidazoline decarboxylase
MTLDDINRSGAIELKKLFESCCHCERWAVDMCNVRPFISVDEMLDLADRLWETATEEELLEAFSGHPQIGDVEALRNKYAANAILEQGQIVEADEAHLKELHVKNQQYLDANGFIFIVCATGKSASEMLDILLERLSNSREVELQIAAKEQGAITQLRLKKMAGS